MYILMYAYTPARIPIQAYQYTYILIYSHTYKLTYAHICICLYAHAHMHTCTHAHMHTCTHTHIHTYTHTHIHAYKHTHNHTLPLALVYLCVVLFHYDIILLRQGIQLHCIFFHVLRVTKMAPYEVGLTTLFISIIETSGSSFYLRFSIWPLDSHTTLKGFGSSNNPSSLRILLK